MPRKILIIGGFALSFIAGAASGYFFAAKKLEDQYVEEAKTELIETRKFYQTLYTKQGFETPEEAVEQLIPQGAVEALEALESYQGREPESEDIKEEGERVERAKKNYGQFFQTPQPEDEADNEPEADDEAIHNVFEEARLAAESEWLSEQKVRDPDVPYIISNNVFFAAEKNYEQITFTYYAGDNVLANSRDEIVEDVDDVVGLVNLQQFGRDSNDPNIVYIRNEKLSLDFEIAKSERAYSKEVLNLTDEDLLAQAPARGEDE